MCFNLPSASPPVCISEDTSACWMVTEKNVPRREARDSGANAGSPSPGEAPDARARSRAAAPSERSLATRAFPRRL